MSHKNQLRKQRAGTIINVTSKKQESDIIKALRVVEDKIKKEFPKIQLDFKKNWLLDEIIKRLHIFFPEIEFHCYSNKSNMRPDGGILFIKKSADGELFPILITEAKNQGTNDIRKAEGKSKQALGNAIERLGKNVIGFRTALLNESIFPFICFGYGCDFSENETIVDRVGTIAMFGKLNKTYLHNEGENRFNRGSFYFREKRWSPEEMSKLMYEIAKGSIYYYFSKYGQKSFEKL